MFSTTKPIRILHLEDNPRDSELVRDLLETDGLDCEIHVVGAGHAFEAALHETSCDIILTDFNVPGYDGMAALQFVQTHAPAVPVIVISGSIGEDAAVKCLRAGATDYLLKDRLDRLPSAVRRALQEAEEERKRGRVEDALRQSEARFSLVAKATSDAIWDWDLRAGQIWWGGRHGAFAVTDAESAVNEVPPWAGAVHPDDLARVRQKISASLEGNDSFWSDEHRFSRRDGSYAIVTNRASIVRDAGGQPLRMVGGMTDITDRKQADARFSAMFHHSPVAIGFLDAAGRIFDGNAQFLEFFGYERAEMIGHTTAELHVWAKPEEEARARAMIREGFRVRNLEVSFRRKRGELRSALLSVEELHLNGDSIRLTMIVDITDRNSLLKQLQRMQRVESVGQLASGIAHDMNNILAPIMMSAPLLRSGLPMADTEKILSTIEASAQRGAALVRQLLLFGRGVEGERRPVDLEAIVSDVVKISQPTFPRNITIRAEVADDLPRVHGDATQLHQVLLNLCVNARDAMPEGGALTIAVDEIEIDALQAAAEPDGPPGKYVRLHVTDTGVGIPPEVAERVFDPFYTTKEPGKGTGLGLSTVLGIVKGHGGFVRLQSVVGEGTTFAVYLPASVAAPPAAPEGRSRQMPRGNGELILIVDDEDSIRAVLRDMLVRFGYKVVAATNGVEAVAVFNSTPGVQLVLTDLDMPMMDGIGLARVLRQLKPFARILISTGVGGRSGAVKRQQDLDMLGIRTVLTKPYSAEKLLCAIRAAFNEPAFRS